MSHWMILFWLLWHLCKMIDVTAKSVRNGLRLWEICLFIKRVRAVNRYTCDEIDWRRSRNFVSTTFIFLEFVSIYMYNGWCWAIQTNYFDPTPGIPKNTTQHQDVSFQSTLDRRPMYYSQNRPVESECKLNNVNSHIIRNQYQIQNQREVTLKWR